MTRLALLANPGSGSGEAEEAEACLRALGAEVSRFRLDDAAAALAAVPERIAVAGGDGSLGVAADAAARVGVPLAVIPVGTANDFARSLALPDDLAGACELAVRGDRLIKLDLARFGARPFVNVASAGLPPLAARTAHGLKGALGSLAYVVGACRVAVTAKPVTCEVECDGTRLFSGDAWQLTVAGTGAFGAGSELDANPHDGKLDVVVIEAGPRIGLIARAYGLRRGGLEEQRGVSSCRATEAIVRTDGSTGFNVDGEVIDEATVRFAIEPAAFELVVG